LPPQRQRRHIAEHVTRSPPLPCRQHSVRFVSAYRDIGRSSWKTKVRTNEEYVARFRRFLHALEYPLVLYIAPALARRLLASTPLPALVDVVDDRNISTYSDTLLNKERRIMHLHSYRRLLPPEALKKPEYTQPQYTLINHDKVSYLMDAAWRYNVTHLIWVDFGMARDASMTPHQLNLCRLPPERILVSGADEIWQPLVPVPPRQMWKMEADKVWSNRTGSFASAFPKDAICDTIMVFPRALVPTYERLYTKELEVWQKQGVAHSDQAMHFQLFKKTQGRLFERWEPPDAIKGGLMRCRVLFPYYLNS